MNNLSLYCGLFDAKIRASDEDLLVSRKSKHFFCRKGFLSMLFFDVKVKLGNSAYLMKVIVFLVKNSDFVKYLI